MPPSKVSEPGPGKYLLPSLTGYKNHDGSRYRNPQYSVGIKTPFGRKGLGPGPRYDVQQLTPFGKASPPAYSLKFRQKPLTTFSPPGPGTYKPELAPRTKEPRPPKYSLAHRFAPYKIFLPPGPNQFSLPTTFGPKVPDIEANAAYSMSFKHSLKQLEKSPGPARYPAVSVNSYKHKSPDYTMPPRQPPPKTVIRSPGPIYAPKLPSCGRPGFSFGLRCEKNPYIVADDDMPCVQRKKCVTKKKKK